MRAGWLTLAAYTITRALESGRTRWVALTGALLGLGYLAKMLPAFLVLPALALAYLGPASLGGQAGVAAAGGLAALVASGRLVGRDCPADPGGRRPFVGGSTDNNILQLTFGYNGLSRLTGNRGGSAGGGGGSRGAGWARAPPAAARPRSGPAVPASGGGGGGSRSAGRPGSPACSRRNGAARSAG